MDSLNRIQKLSCIWKQTNSRPMMSASQCIHQSFVAYYHAFSTPWTTPHIGTQFLHLPRNTRPLAYTVFNIMNHMSIRTIFPLLSRSPSTSFSTPPGSALLFKTVSPFLVCPTSRPRLKTGDRAGGRGNPEKPQNFLGGSAPQTPPGRGIAV